MHALIKCTWRTRNPSLAVRTYGEVLLMKPTPVSRLDLNIYVGIVVTAYWTIFLRSVMEKPF